MQCLIKGMKSEDKKKSVCVRRNVSTEFACLLCRIQRGELLPFLCKFKAVSINLMRFCIIYWILSTLTTDASLLLQNIVHCIYICIYIYHSGTHQFLAYANDVNILRGSIHMVKENAEALVVATKEIGLEVNADKTKYMVMSRE